MGELIVKKRTCVFALAAVALAVAAPARAQHAHSDMEIGSTADGGGDLTIEYDFGSVVRTDFAGLVGPFALYSSSNPGFTPAEDEPLEGLFELDPGTTLSMTLVTIDPALQVQYGATVMSAPGESAVLGTHDVPGEDGALHKHPTFRLLLDAPEGEFGEGTVSFKLEGDPLNPTAYGASETYSLHVSNGYLPGNENPDALAGARCQKAVAQQVRALVGKQYKTLSGCLDTIQDWKAKGGDLATPSNALLRRCSTDPAKGVVAKLASDRQKALAAAGNKCGGTFEETAVSTHLGMAQCRTQELIGAAYSSALEDLAVVLFGDDEEAAGSALPCVKETQGETHDED